MYASVTTQRRQSPEERKLYQRCDEHGLGRDERLELACYLLRRDITSFKNLTPPQVLRLLDAIEGHELITELKAMRGPSSAPEGEADVERQPAGRSLEHAQSTSRVRHSRIRRRFT